jgi:hypothetical protein
MLTPDDWSKIAFVFYGTAALALGFGIPAVIICGVMAWICRWADEKHSNK